MKPALIESRQQHSIRGHCAYCGYALIVAGPAYRCPECGHRAIAGGQIPLKLAPPGWVRTLSLGAKSLQVTGGLAVAVVLGKQALLNRTTTSAILVLCVLGLCVSVALLLRQGPAVISNGRKLNRLCSLAAIGACLAAIVDVIRANHYSRPLVLLLSAISATVVLFRVASILRELGERRCARLVYRISALQGGLVSFALLSASCSFVMSKYNLPPATSLSYWDQWMRALFVAGACGGPIYAVGVILARCLDTSSSQNVSG